MALSRLATTGVLAVSVVGIAACSAAGSTPNSSSTPTSVSGADDGITVSPRADRQAAPGPADWFTGSVSITSLLDATESSAAGAGEVSFEPGARTAWHTHPAGQRLIVTEGRGWVQEWGGERRDMRAGDVVSIAPGVKHWHGATSADAMTHIAIQDTVDGRNVDWLEKVDDTRYRNR